MRTFLGRSRRARLRPAVLGEVLVVLCLLRVYDLVRAAADSRRVSALHHGNSLLRLESWLRIDIEHAANVWVSAHHPVSLAATYFYQYAHVSVTLVVLSWCWLRRPDLYRPARNALVLTNLVGLAVFYLLPVAPPRLLPGYGFVDTVAQAGFGTSHGGPVAADQYGALPSLHLAWAVWVAVVAGRMLAGRWPRRAVFGYPLAVTGVVMVTANHYLLDAVAGTAVALAALLVADRATPRSGRVPAQVRAPSQDATERAPRPRPVRA
jgi:hypothetical protein